MQAFNPQVRVLNERGDPLHILDSLLHTDAFDILQLHQEDRDRHREYELRAARAAPSQPGGLLEFLTSLELRARLEPVNKGNIQRVVQLLAKTNQFNLTTRRHRLEDVLRMLSLPGAVGLTLRLIDKFGDQGIVALILAAPTPEPGGLLVDTFLMSCRVIGRGVEDALWAALANHAAKQGIVRILGDYIPTAKNGLAEGFYQRLGLRHMEDLKPGARFVLEPVRPVTFPAWMKVEDPTL
jgi:FkbH-like protein